MSESYLGQVILFAGPYNIKNFMPCNGQVLSINQYTALFAILGTSYGGNGQTTFALPDLRSRVPVHIGQGGGLSAYTLGQNGGAENVTLSLAQMPTHNHMMNVQNGNGSLTSPANNFLATTATRGSTPVLDTYASSISSQAQLAATAISPNGSSQSHPNLQPFLAMNYQICVAGIFPSRN